MTNNAHDEIRGLRLHLEQLPTELIERLHKLAHTLRLADVPEKAAAIIVSRDELLTLAAALTGDSQGVDVANVAKMLRWIQVAKAHKFSGLITWEGRPVVVARA